MNYFIKISFRNMPVSSIKGEPLFSGKQKLVLLITIYKSFIKLAFRHHYFKTSGVVRIERRQLIYESRLSNNNRDRKREVNVHELGIECLFIQQKNTFCEYFSS